MSGKVVPIHPVLKQWLRWIKSRNYPFYPPNHRDKCGWVRTVIADHRATFQGLLQGPGRKDHRFYNIARRSYLSYRLALPSASFAAVADEAGNSEMVIRKYYQNRATRREAGEYFGLLPARV